MGKNLKGKELGKGISQRKDGVYMARFTVPGKKSPVCLYNKSLTELRKEFKDYREKYNAEEEINVSSITFDQWFQKWFFVYQGNSKDTTRQNYIDRYNNQIKKYIGHLKLAEIKQVHIQNTLTDMFLEGYAYATVESAKTLIKMVIERAYDNGYISSNPARRLTMPAKPASRKVPLSKNMEEKFFRAIAGQRYEGLFRILLHTGMRIGEAVALEWRDVDFDAKTIHVNKTLVHAKTYNRQGEKISNARYKINSTKNVSSDRIIPLMPLVEVEFIKWRKQQDRDRLRANWGEKNIFKDRDLIFTTVNGTPLSPQEAWCYCNQGVSRVNEDEIILADIEKREPQLLSLHPHIFRHTFATRCIESGMHPKAVQKLLGHANLQMLEIYTHPSIDFVKNELEKYSGNSNISVEIDEDEDRIIFFQKGGSGVKTGV